MVSNIKSENEVCKSKVSFYIFVFPSCFPKFFRTALNFLVKPQYRVTFKHENIPRMHAKSRAKFWYLCGILLLFLLELYS